jgi:hypothetical protein
MRIPAMIIHAYAKNETMNLMMPLSFVRPMDIDSTEINIKPIADKAIHILINPSDIVAPP